MRKPDMFDEIISFLSEESEKNLLTEIDSTLAKSFFSDIEKLKVREAISDRKTDTVRGNKATVQESSPDQGSNLARLNAIEDLVKECRKCRLHLERTNTVFGSGSPSAELMFIGEGPGKDEDLQGLPFVGRAGELLTRMINAMQFDRKDVYIANIVKCRPPENRNPEDDETEQCVGYLKSQIDIIRPKVIVLLGAVPLKVLLGKTGITKIHGEWHEFQGIKTMPTFHPAYLLRNPPAKKPTWEDLKKVMAVLGKKV